MDGEGAATASGSCAGRGCMERGPSAPGCAWFNGCAGAEPGTWLCCGGVFWPAACCWAGLAAGASGLVSCFAGLGVGPGTGKGPYRAGAAGLWVGNSAGRLGRCRLCRRALLHSCRGILVRLSGCRRDGSELQCRLGSGLCSGLGSRLGCWSLAGIVARHDRIWGLLGLWDG